jgi:AcrR family transcriptional regulator
MPVEPATPKSERTRARILAAAHALFAEKGFAATTMRDIAERAEVSVGAAYRYFARKEDLGVALYEQRAAQMTHVAMNLPGGTIADRFAVMMRATIDHLEQRRDTFLALAARAFDPRDDLGVLGTHTDSVRAQARAGWEIVVLGADDAPRDEAARSHLADALYAADLLVVLVWTQDRDPARRATEEAIAAMGQLMAAGMPLLWTPFGAAALAQVAGIASRLGIGR